MTYGPIDYIAFKLPGNQFEGHILHALIDLVERDIIRIIDLVGVRKDGEGAVEMQEMRDLAPEVLDVLGPLKAVASGILTVGDIEDVANQLENNTYAALMLIENRWAVRTMEAMERAEAQLVMYDRIPHQVILDALKEIIAMEAAE